MLAKRETSGDIFYTIPALSKAAEGAISAKRLRAEIRAGRLRAYTLGGKWPRVAWSDYLTWLRSTRVMPTAHAHARAAEILERELAREQAP